MKVSKVTKLKEKYKQYDLSTETENFYVRAGGRWILVHNSPSLFAGIDPSDGQFFVAKKGIFNKNPKIYKTAAEVKADLSGDLQTKFLVALEEFPKLGIRSGVYQGDLMFTSDTVNRETIDGEKYYTFQPNTILYAVPVKSNLGRKIRKSKIGIVWHTTYTGSSFESMKAQFAKNITSKFKTVSSIWQDDATVTDLSGTATFTKSETDELTKMISDAGKLFQRTPAGLLDSFSQNDEVLIRVKKFINDHVRANKIVNPKSSARDLMNYIHDFYQSEIDKKKTARGKETWEAKKKEAMVIFTKYNARDFESLFAMMNKMSEAKQVIINKLNELNKMSTFLRTRTGFEVTSQEGFVAVDHMGDAIKLVDRMEFSRANFNPEILKGWN